jgi:heme exporter protein CcmD
MDPRYAFFIWASFGIGAVVVLWNVLAPWQARNQLRQRLSEAAEDSGETDA